MGRLGSMSISTLLVIAFFMLAFDIQLVSAEYRYVDLTYLAIYEESFLGKEIMTSGIFRSDFVFIPETSANAVLEDQSSQAMLGIYINPFWNPANGSVITVYGVVDYDFWGGYCFYVQYWELGSFFWWNLADINRDLKVDIFDVIHVVNAYDSIPSDSHWDPFCDITEPYGIIDIYDVVMICMSYGEVYNP